MRDVVVIGGGLSGLAAAYELEKRGVPYTLIEVKSRLGGSIESVESNGFIFDSAPMCHAVDDPAFFEAYLAELGLKDAVFINDDGLLVFHRGTQVLIDALKAKITAPIMFRMAVSTLGMLDAERFAICMENGLLLDAKALIVAAPARYAERMFYTLVPEIAFRLLDYRYDNIVRVSLGYSHTNTLPLEYGHDTPIVDLRVARRMPKDSLTVQAALRIEEAEQPFDVVGELAALMGWGLNPAADHIARWNESDPIMWRQSDHVENMHRIQALLPMGVALIGSDYIPTNKPPHIDERIRQGLQAAQALVI
ncbi:MAG: hypothetical protein CUN56_09200 [Phototrophicales bacterium]|nr:MAG: hypothetical protein CUN56_09200 [Phototrophicales bacterium]